MRLSGSIPSSIGSLTNMVTLAINLNELTGQLPQTISNLQKLEYLYMSDNKLSGPLTEELWSIGVLKSLYMDNNTFSGSISGSISKLVQLEILLLKVNELTGTVPNEISKLTALQVLALCQNNMHGTIDSEIFNNSINLEKVYLSQNSFSGPFPFIASNNLQQLDVAYNLFSGAIPSAYFRDNSPLQLFSASLNCLSAELPSTICEAKNLQEVLFCGAHRNPNCILYSGYGTSLPSCIWSMQSLQRLYLAGNSFFGQIDNFDLINIDELSIGYNKFRGVIPMDMNKAHDMQILDVSHNLLTGTLGNIFIEPSNVTDAQTSYKAAINRLSGHMNKDQIQRFDEVDVLSGNMIDCGDEPENDSDVITYTCESQSLQYSVYIWLTAGGTFILFIALFFYYKMGSAIGELQQALHKWFRECQRIQRNDIKVVTEKFPAVVQMLKTLNMMAISSIRLTIAVLVLSIIIYSSLKFGDHAILYRTHDDQYWYTLSGVYLKEFGAAICVYLLFCVTVSLIMYVFFRRFYKDWRLLKGLHVNRKSFVREQSEHRIAWTLW